MLTDLSVLSSEFSSRNVGVDSDFPSDSPSLSNVFSEGQQGKKLLVHAGFLLAFESLVKEIVSILLLLLLLLLLPFFYLHNILLF